MRSKHPEEPKVNPVPVATHEGTTTLLGKPMPCAVLKGGDRVFLLSAVMGLFGTDASHVGRRRKQAEKEAEKSGDDFFAKPASFLLPSELSPFAGAALLDSANLFTFRTVNGRIARGCRAELVQDIADAYLDAEQAGALRENQRHIARQAFTLIRGLARVALAALVDEACGYRPEDRAYERLLDLYVTPTLQQWVRRFPPEFFEEMGRLGLGPFGREINRRVYAQLPPGVLEFLQTRSPKSPETGRRRYILHRFLTADTGCKHLDKQIESVLTLMQGARDKERFEESFARRYPEDRSRVIAVLERHLDESQLAFYFLN